MQPSIVSSSLSALDQIQLTKIKSRKRLWITFIITATFLAIYQTADIICSYLDPPIKHSETEVMNDVNLVATACFTNPLSYNHANLSEEQILILKKMENLSGGCDIYQPSLFCLSLLSERDRFQIGFLADEDQFIFMLGVSIYQVFNNLLYGNCATLGYKDSDKNSKTFDLRQTFFLVKNQKLLPMIIIIHEGKTFPVFKSKNIVLLNSQNLRVLVSVKKTLFASELIGADCIPKTSQPMQRWNTLGNKEHNYAQYIYSYESCLDQCLYALTKQYCTCILPNSLRGQNIEMLPFCDQYCNKIPKEVMETLCNCKFSCENVEVTADRQSEYTDDEQTKLLLISNYYRSDKLTVENLFKRTSEVVTFHEISIWQSLTTKLTIMESALKLEDALSTIGGIWGFWMGLSISVLLALAIDIIPKSAKKFSFCSIITIRRCAKIMNKILWNIGRVLITTALIWQLYLIITEYLRYNVLRVTTTRALNSHSFPSVIVCYSGMFCNIEKELQNNFNLLKKVNDYKMKQTKYYELLENITEKEKDLLHPKMNDFVVSCEFETNTKLKLPCELQQLMITTFETTRCVIINANDALKFRDINIIQSLKLKLQFPRCYQCTSAPLKIGFHPLYYMLGNKIPLEIIHVVPGDLVDVKYSLTETNRLPSPYPSQCIYENMKYSIWPNELTNISHLLKYSYNFKDCLNLCFLKFNKDFNSFSGDPRDLCSNATNVDICGCKHSCRDRDYTYKISKTEYAFKKKPHYLNFSTVAEVEDYLWQGFAVVNVEGETNHKTVITEKPAIFPDSLVGLIGGVCGLWIGQSILTIIIELHTIGTIIVSKIVSLLKMIYNHINYVQCNSM